MSKTTNAVNTREQGGLLYRPHFTNEGPIWCAIADPWRTLTCLHAKFRLNRFILSPSGGEKRQFLPYFRPAFSRVASWQQSQKVEHGCTTTSLPLSNGVKIVCVLQRLHGEIGRTNSDVQKRDGHA